MSRVTDADSDQQLGGTIDACKRQITMKAAAKIVDLVKRALTFVQRPLSCGLPVKSPKCTPGAGRKRANQMCIDSKGGRPSHPGWMLITFSNALHNHRRPRSTGR